MFKTYDDGKVDSSSIPSKSGLYFWEYMIFNSSAPWLLVTARMTESDGDTWTQSYMLTNPKQLVNLMKLQKVFLHRIQLVRPNCQKTLGWDFDDVLKIRAAITEDCADSAEDVADIIEYQFLGGEKSTYVDGKKSSVKCKGLKQIYSILSQ